MEQKAYIAFFLVLLLSGMFLNTGCDNTGRVNNTNGTTLSAKSSSAADRLLDEYEATVNRYVPRFKNASTSMEFQMVSMELMKEAQSFIERFNAISGTIDPADFGRLQSRLNQINQKYTALCQGR